MYILYIYEPRNNNDSILKTTTVYYRFYPQNLLKCGESSALHASGTPPAISYARSGLLS